jgi:large subunit ribosomal protein L4
LTGALTSRANDEKIVVVDKITCEPAKTKTMAQMIAALALNGKRNLLVVDKNGTALYKAGRNIKDLDIRPLSEINAHDILTNENIIFGGKELIGKLEEAVAS